VKVVLPVVLIGLATFFSACGDDGEVEDTPSASPVPSASLAPTHSFSPEPSPSPTIGSTATPALEPGLLSIGFEGTSGDVALIVELADSPDERYQGLRNRQSMDENRGMLFAWPADATSAFGMPETYIPLTIAFVREDGTIIHFEDMEPLSSIPYRSPEPYRYAIEANQGWFNANGIVIGDAATIPAEAADDAQ